MSTSVFSYPAPYTYYPDSDTFNAFANVAAYTINAVRDENSQIKSLFLGASSNVVVEAAKALDMYVSSDLNLYTTTPSNATSKRIDDMILNISRSFDCNTTFISSTAKHNLAFTTCNTINLGSLVVDVSQGSNDVIYTNKTSLVLSNNTSITGNLKVLNNLVTYGSVFGRDVNMWNTKSNATVSNDMSQVGYGFRINSNTDQLELIKHVRFKDDKSVEQKIAVFGYTNPGYTASSDVSYLVFNNLNGVGTALSNGQSIVPMTSPLDNHMFVNSTTSNVGVGQVAPQYKLDVKGTGHFTGQLTLDSGIALTGSIIPTADQVYNLGSPDYKFKSLYVASNTIFIGDYAVSASPTGLVIKNSLTNVIIPNNTPAQTTDLVNVTSSVILATATAVRTANDKGIAASNAAFAVQGIAAAASNNAASANSTAIAASNVAYGISSTATQAQTIAISASNIAIAAQQDARAASNVAYSLNNSVTSAQTNASIASSNAATSLQIASSASNIASPLSNVAYGAQTAAAVAQTTASTAQTAASSAQTAASAAQSTATAASNVAYATSNFSYPLSNVAYNNQTRSIAASNVAYGAQTAAAAAQTTATTAQTTASTAQTTASTAQTTASTAQTTATSAQTTATAASNNSFTKVSSQWVTNATNIYTNCNVGIGIVTPSVAFDVVGSIKASGNANVQGDITVGGNLTVNGTTTTVNTQNLLVSDNLITLNSSLSTAPPAFLWGGIEVNRGTSPDYYFVFQESSSLFKVGLSNNLQAVATREDAPSTNAIATWNPTNKGFVTYTNNVISPAGYIGVGTANPTYPIHVTSSASSVSIHAAFDIVAFSDRRVKTDFLPISNALEKVNRINGYTFIRSDVDDVNQKRIAGVIAQEVKEVLPEVVHEDSAGMYSVAYGNMAALFIEAIKELSAKVDSLDAKLQTN